MTVTGAGEPASTVEPAADAVVDGFDVDGVDIDGVDIDGAGLDEVDLGDDYYQSRPPGPASGDNPDYVRWLVEESMLGAPITERRRAARTSSAPSSARGS